MPTADRSEAPDPRGRAYRGERITVYYDARRCCHFAECVRGLHDVFNTNARPWIQPDNAGADLLAEVVRRCPTGALHYELVDGPDEEQPGPTRVEAVKDGPLLLRGEMLVQTSAGELRDVRAALCRCGLTANQPFCDEPASAPDGNPRSLNALQTKVDDAADPPPLQVAVRIQL